MSVTGIPAEVIDALPAGSWIVGGAVRDDLLRRPVTDVDVTLEGDPEAEARRLSAAVGGCAVFPLNDEFGAWRVLHRRSGWQVDFSPLAGGSIGEDLRRRDFTVNAIARAVGAEETFDPLGGRSDLESGTLRSCSPSAFADDPLRVLRLTRFECELGFRTDAGTLEQASAAAPGLGAVAGERCFSELAMIISSSDPVAGLRSLEDSGALAAILPELLELQGVSQSDYHHLDCWEHTLLVLDEVVRLQVAPERLGPAGESACRLLTQDLADGLDRWQVLRLAALLHDIAKPGTRETYPDGRIGFPNHDSVGAGMVEVILARLRTSARLTATVRAEVLDHLTAGFLTHDRDIGPRAIWDYLRRTGDVAVDVTVLSVADRLATLGRNSEDAIERHLRLAHRLLEAAVELESSGPQPPLVRGDQLAAELGISPGPELGLLLAEIEAARYAAEVTTPDEAVEHARRFRSADGGAV